MQLHTTTHFAIQLHSHFCSSITRTLSFSHLIQDHLSSLFLTYTNTNPWRKIAFSKLNYHKLQVNTVKYFQYIKYFGAMSNFPRHIDITTDFQLFSPNGDQTFVYRHYISNGKSIPNLGNAVLLNGMNIESNANHNAAQKQTTHVDHSKERSKNQEENNRNNESRRIQGDGNNRKEIKVKDLKKITEGGNRNRSKPPTHFISLPLNNDSSQMLFDDIKNRFIKRCQEQNVYLDEALLQNAIRTHITLQVLHIFEDNQLQAALEIFKAIDLKAFGFYNDGVPYFQYGSMNAFCSRSKLENSYVTYIEIEEGSNKKALNKLIGHIREKFHEIGIILDTKEPIIHVTFLNVKFSKRTKKFDAKPYFEIYDSVRQDIIQENGGSMPKIYLDTLHFSKMLSRSRNHYYDFEDHMKF